MSTQMTRTEFYQKYGHHEVVFSGYYKFEFSYSKQLEDGSTLTVSYGGYPDEVYRFECVPNTPISVLKLQPFSGGVFKDGKEIEGFNDYP